MEKEDFADKDYEPLDEGAERIKDTFRSIEDEEPEVKRVKFEDSKGQKKDFLANVKADQERGWRDISPAIWEFFETDPSKLSDKEAEKLKDISKFAFSDNRSLSEGLRKLREIQIQVGLPRGQEKSYDKIWEFVAIENQVKDLQARQHALEGPTYDIRSYIVRE